MTAGDYTFALSSDEGSRLRIGNAVLIENAGDGTCSKSVYTTKIMPVGQQFIQVNYFQNYGTSCITLRYKGDDTNNIMVVVPEYVLKAPAGRLTVDPVVPQGWGEEIYNFRPGCVNPRNLGDNIALRMPAKVRQVRSINYPFPYVPNQIWSGFDRTTDFAARWTTRLLFRGTGTYEFKLLSAGESKMYLEHQVIIDSGKSHPRRETTGKFTTSKKSVRHGIRVEYFNSGARNSKQQPACLLTYKGPDTGMKWALLSMAIGGHEAKMSIRLKHLDYDKLMAKTKDNSGIFNKDLAVGLKRKLIAGMSKAVDLPSIRATVKFKKSGKGTHVTVHLTSPLDATDVLWRRGLNKFTKIGFYAVFQMVDEYKDLWRAMEIGTTLDADSYLLSDMGCNEEACRIPFLSTPATKLANKLLKHMSPLHPNGKAGVPGMTR